MTITITAAHVEVIGYVITCCDGAAEQAPRYGSYEDAGDALALIPGGNDYGCDGMRVVLPGCEMPDVCPEYPLHVQAIGAEAVPEVHINNRNAATVLDTLGLADAVDPTVGGDSGELTAEDLLGRVLTARALTPVDAGIPAHHIDARHIEGSRRPGYLQDRLDQLETLAHWAQQHHTTITWH